MQRHSCESRDVHATINWSMGAAAIESNKMACRKQLLFLHLYEFRLLFPLPSSSALRANRLLRAHYYCFRLMMMAVYIE
jgi:hypothetical protein